LDYKRHAEYPSQVMKKPQTTKSNSYRRRKKE